MSIWKKFRNNLNKSSKKVSDVTEDLVEKGKNIGEEGWDSLKDILSQIGDKATDLSLIVKLKIKSDAQKTRFSEESLILGNQMLNMHRGKASEKLSEQIETQLNKMVELEAKINETKHEYDQLRKSLSDGYVVDKLKNDLSNSGIIIEQVVISDKSNVVDKLLKEILLPKEALVSAIKRNENVIIPDGNTQFLRGDLVTVLGKESDVNKIVKRFSASS